MPGRWRSYFLSNELIYYNALFLGPGVRTDAVVVANMVAGGDVGIDVDVDVVVDVDVGVEGVVIAGVDLDLDEVPVGEGVGVLGECHLSQVLAR